MVVSLKYFSILQAELINIQQVISWYIPGASFAYPCQLSFTSSFTW